MITGVTGVLEATGQDWVEVRVGGSVSLQIFVPASSVAKLGDVGQEVRLHTRLFIRDDEPVLYGFATPEALRMFQMLNSVSGIGPRIALALLSSLGPQPLAEAVVTGDVDALSRVSGVGRKSAGRLILELRGKLEKELTEAPIPDGARDDSDVISALMALGYSATESRRVLSSMESTGMDSPGDAPLEEKLRRALQHLAG